MTKILNFALKIKGGGREGGTCEVLRPCHPPKIWNVHLGKVEYAKYIPQLKTHSKQKELERVWELITKDREWAIALRKQKIV